VYTITILDGLEREKEGRKRGTGQKGRRRRT